MSLIEAKIADGALLLASDTRFSRNEEGTGEMNGGLKLHILSNEICVGFAGNTHDAMEVLQECSDAVALGNPQQIASILSDNASDQTSFLLCTLRPELRIQRFPEQSDRDQNEAWIGRSTAHNLFLRKEATAFTDRPVSEERLGYQLIDMPPHIRPLGPIVRYAYGMEAVVRSNAIATVGDFFALVASYPEKGFRYLNYWDASILPSESEWERGTIDINKDRWLAEDGKVTLMLKPRDQSLPACAFYQTHKRRGVVFIAGVLESRAFVANSFEEFLSSANERANVEFEIPFWWGKGGTGTLRDGKIKWE